MSPEIVKQMLAIAQEGSEIKRTAKIMAAAGVTQQAWLADPLYRLLPSPYSLGLANALRGIEMNYNGVTPTAATDAIYMLKRAVRLSKVPKPPRR